MCSIKKYDIVGGKVCDPYSTDSMNNSIDLKMLKSCLDHHRRRRLEAKFLRNHPQLHSGGRLDQPEPTDRPAGRPTHWLTWFKWIQHIIILKDKIMNISHELAKLLDPEWIIETVFCA